MVDSIREQRRAREHDEKMQKFYEEDLARRQAAREKEEAHNKIERHKAVETK